MNSAEAGAATIPAKEFSAAPSSGSASYIAHNPIENVKYYRISGPKLSVMGVKLGSTVAQRCPVSACFACPKKRRQRANLGNCAGVARLFVIPKRHTG